MLGALGFENAYGLAMRRDRAERLGIATIADLAAHAAELAIGGDLEFFARPEWNALQAAYGLQFASRREFGPTFMYQAVVDGEVDVISAFTSDGRIAADDSLVLADPAGAILPYDAIVLIAAHRAEDAVLRRALEPLVGAIPLSLCRRRTTASIAIGTRRRRRRLHAGSSADCSTRRLTSMRFFKEAVAANSALLFGMALLTLGAGLQATLLGVRATLEGLSTFVTGAVMAAYYVGFVIGSITAPMLVRRVGHIRVFAALTATAAAAILVQGVFFGAWTWAILRIVSGVCFAGIYVVAESWLNDRADQRSRGVVARELYGRHLRRARRRPAPAGAADPSGYVLFILIGVLISLAVVPIALTAQRAPDFALPSRVSFRKLLAISPLGAAGALFSGATAGTLFSLGPVYAARSGLDTTAVATFMASSILPAIALQLPLGRLSDRVDRRSVLIGISIAAAAAALAAVQLGIASLAFFVAVAAYGGLSLTTYAVCLAHVNDHLHPTQMVAASATVLLANGIGSVLGPPGRFRRDGAGWAEAPFSPASSCCTRPSRSTRPGANARPTPSRRRRKRGSSARRLRQRRRVGLARPRRSPRRRC